MSSEQSVRLPKVVEYTVLVWSTEDEQCGSMEQLVFDALGQGWQPLGGIATYRNCLMQAMVKYEAPSRPANTGPMP